MRRGLRLDLLSVDFYAVSVLSKYYATQGGQEETRLEYLVVFSV